VRCLHKHRHYGTHTRHPARTTRRAAEAIVGGRAPNGACSPPHSPKPTPKPQSGAGDDHPPFALLPSSLSRLRQHTHLVLAAGRRRDCMASGGAGTVCACVRVRACVRATEEGFFFPLSERPTLAAPHTRKARSEQNAKKRKAAGRLLTTRAPSPLFSQCSPWPSPCAPMAGAPSAPSAGESVLRCFGPPDENLAAARMLFFLLTLLPSHPPKQTGCASRTTPR
jgi:hypothetical protein